MEWILKSQTYCQIVKYVFIYFSLNQGNVGGQHQPGGKDPGLGKGRKISSRINTTSTAATTFH